MSAVPFKIDVPDHKLQRLKQKLALTDFPEAFGDGDKTRDRGVPLCDIKRLTTCWRDAFDWRKAESELNQLPQYTIPIDVEGFSTHNVHFVHRRSDVSDAIPLLFLHGWPGSFLEVKKILPLLTSNSGLDVPTFHVVAPSLIDFGFSSSSSQANFNVDQHAETYHKLMQKLGYNEYVIQAGDVGHVIARFIAKRYGPKHCKAQHINSPGPSQPDPILHPELYAKAQQTTLTERELANLQRGREFVQRGLGYYHQQSTRPLTIGYSLRDSPVGLLAWIHEKLHDWVDGYVWTDEEILTWVCIHYFSTAGPEAASSMYYAFESREPDTAFTVVRSYIDVPLGISRFLNDLVVTPSLWCQSLGPVVFEREHDRGGHFAAWERPDAIVEDLRAMFGRGGGAHKCIK